MPTRTRLGLLTEIQLMIIRLRDKGLTQQTIAERLGTTRQNIALIEKRARRNIKLAQSTLIAYKQSFAEATIPIAVGTHRVDIPRIVVDVADKANIRLQANFTRIYDEIHFTAAECIQGARIVHPLTIFVLKNGDIEVAVGEPSGAIIID